MLCAIFSRSAFIFSNSRKGKKKKYCRYLLLGEALLIDVFMDASDCWGENSLMLALMFSYF